MSFHWILHLIVSALIRGLIYMEVWKVARHLSALDVFICIVVLVLAIALLRGIWRRLFGYRRYY
ncbi:hypothetical protein RIE95_11680 [Acidithiobacillus thiooxidans]|uniref:hypothetical protein n=1 Tax=Acidithiobacillus TaxID=119977 RepID=UPI0004E1F470|nr:MULTISPECIES: hypothetical protein [Acidithiobacillus]MBE7567471.1 hypothetical protein [Acidithiobacillus sp. HP-11]MBU2751724.1 hypothetical protein [Acidithiobacillus thiooxidans]MDR7927636.1 hypothetical protein [Acidithiobacillus thiooxidans]